MAYSRFIATGFLLSAVALIPLWEEKDRPTVQSAQARSHRALPSDSVLTGLATSPCHAPATADLGYIGEHIIHVGNSREGSVGYKFSVVSLACFHLWTWGGTYCVYEHVVDKERLTEKYRPISPAEAARLLGKNESELETPFWYRWPPGRMLLVAFAVFLGICGLLRVAGLLPRNTLACPQCGRRQAASTRICPCGHTFEVGSG
jgi:hypothetical protein